MLHFYLITYSFLSNYKCFIFISMLSWFLYYNIKRYFIRWNMNSKLIAVNPREDSYCFDERKFIFILFGYNLWKNAISIYYTVSLDTHKTYMSIQAKSNFVLLLIKKALFHFFIKNVPYTLRNNSRENICFP